MVNSLDGQWLIARDPADAGREEKWWERPAAGAEPTPVPWIIQAVFRGYHGLAWYWRDFDCPANPYSRGRYLLRFWAVDYKADVWLNGVYLGEHEGGETPFVFDATEAIEPGSDNRIAVRVLNPTHEPIDGIVLNETPHRNRAMPFAPGAGWNRGGIVDSVELIRAPAVRIEDLFVRPDCETGQVRVRANVRNAFGGAVEGRLHFAIAAAGEAETLEFADVTQDLAAEDTVVETTMELDSPHLWDLDDPYLYRVTARVQAEGVDGVHERSVRCGFRDFRYEGGYFRLNGRRIFLRGSHTGNDFPIGLHQVAPDPDFPRRDLLDVKVMGFNMIRFIAGIATRRQLDLCDEIGLLVYEESLAAWCLEDSDQMAERYDRSTLGMVRRDRNHPSVVIWGLLNETEDGPVFRHAVDALSRVRALDDTRMVMLNSGRWDGQLRIGSIANPGSASFDGYLGSEGPQAEESSLSAGGYVEGAGDLHLYPRVPHTADVIERLRTIGAPEGHAFLSEYGIGSAVDLMRVVAVYEQRGAGESDDAQLYRQQRDEFLRDWERWELGDTFAGPQEYFHECLAKMAGQRQLGLNAIRANPNLIGYSLTGTVDQGMTGEGLTTTWRELKPGTVDAMFDGFAPLRWCLFAAPSHVYRGRSVRLEAVLANEDALPAGEYGVRLQVIGPENSRVWERETTVEITGDGEPPFALPVFAEDVTINAPGGRYRLLAGFVEGAAAAGGEAEFYITDPADMPKVDREVVLWGEDDRLRQWLSERGVAVRAFSGGAPERSEVILAGATPPDAKAKAFRDLAEHIAAGCCALFPCPEVFGEEDDAVRWVPLANKGQLAELAGWLYLRDEWCKRHPIFRGLPSGELMDYTLYRRVIPDRMWSDQDAPAEAVAGAIKASQGYSSGLFVSTHRLGAGRFILSTLRIRDNIGQDPVADRLLGNMLRYAARHTKAVPAERPADFDEQLRAIGYLQADR